MDSNYSKLKKEIQTINVGLIQSTVSADIKVNLQKTLRMVEEAAKKGAQIICLQELYNARYFPQNETADAEKFAETIPGESTNAFSRLAKKHKIVIIVPLFEKHPNGKYYNSAVVIDSDGKLMETHYFTKKTISKPATWVIKFTRQLMQI
jgi:predicted amidohydrolase